MDILETTIQEALQAQPEIRATAMAALIRARYHVIEKAGQTGEGLPVFVSVKIGNQRYGLSVNGSEEKDQNVPLTGLPHQESGDISE